MFWIVWALVVPSQLKIWISEDLLTISLLSCLPVWRLSEDYLVLLPASLCWSMPEDTLWAFWMVSSFSSLSPSLFELWVPISCVMVSRSVSYYGRGDFPHFCIWRLSGNWAVLVPVLEENVDQNRRFLQSLQTDFSIWIQTISLSFWNLQIGQFLFLGRGGSYFLSSQQKQLFNFESDGLPTQPCIAHQPTKQL